MKPLIIESISIFFIAHIILFTGLSLVPHLIF